MQIFKLSPLAALTALVMLQSVSAGFMEGSKVLLSTGPEVAHSVSDQRELFIEAVGNPPHEAKWAKEFWDNHVVPRYGHYNMPTSGEQWNGFRQAKLDQIRLKEAKANARKYGSSSRGFFSRDR